MPIIEADDSPSSGNTEPSENRRNKYFSVSLCVEKNWPIVNYPAKCRRMYATCHQKCFHLILMLYGHSINVNDCSISAAFYFAVLFDCGEYFPSPLAIL